MSQAVKSFVPKALRGPEHHAQVRGVTSEFLGGQVVTRKLTGPSAGIRPTPPTPHERPHTDAGSGGRARSSTGAVGLQAHRRVACGVLSAPGGGTPSAAVPTGKHRPLG